MGIFKILGKIGNIFNAKKRAEEEAAAKEAAKKRRRAIIIGIIVVILVIITLGVIIYFLSKNEKVRAKVREIKAAISSKLPWNQKEVEICECDFDEIDSECEVVDSCECVDAQ